ncbi:MAG TPA: helicase C-terminal domain-containing protein, partial [Terriglobia bacterium]|nr:helicase C-terminal domain-containing protein [Terriglobia bacterium]
DEVNPRLRCSIHMVVKSQKTTEHATLERIFGTSGWLARHHPSFEYRPGQLEMAEAIESSLQNGQHLIVEAGTGTGKTLAYLVPLIRSGQRVVISTGTKNLQEQLYYKDIPFIQKLFPKLRATLMKGRQNYLCRQKLYDIERQPVLNGLEEVDLYQQLREWERRTETGDRTEVAGLRDSSELWQRVDARRETCTGQKCPQFERCFITWMHQRAAESDLIIVNHHLFFADLALKQSDYASLLPDYTAVVFDEAHEIEDVATQYFGQKVSNYQIEELARDTEATLKAKAIESGEVLSAVRELRRRSELFFELFPAGDGRTNFDNRESFLEVRRGTYSAFVNSLIRLETELLGVKDRPEEINNVARRAAEIRKALEVIMESRDRSLVYWWERRGRGVFIEASPIDVSPILRERLFGNVRTVILTSATLAVGGKFDFLKRRLGVETAREKILESHFDFARQAILYTPLHLPDPRHAEFSSRAAGEIVSLLKATEGRAFVLFTSYQQMRAVYELVRRRLRYPLMMQGSMPRNALLEKFRSTPHAVLFATSSFWQGVDVQGQQLSAVIVDRLPFSVPSDPVVAARIRQINEEGGNAFVEYQIPEAVIALKQGFGRLIRSETDRGVLGILDHRIVKKHYGKIFFDSLPPYRRAGRLEEVSEFMQECL